MSFPFGAAPIPQVRPQNRKTPSTKPNPINIGNHAQSATIRNFGKDALPGQFTIVEQLGQGSYGSVWLGQHQPTGLICAIKAISTESHDLNAIQKEIAFMRSLYSPYIVQYFGSVKNGIELWILMEYCSGGSVRDIMTILNEPIPENEIACIIKSVMRGLRYLHSEKKIHRDIKAGNIMIDGTGEAKLGDFGISGTLEELKKRKSVIGSPYWMAPEIISSADFDERADIWSVGITCIEMVEMKPPRSDIPPFQVIYQITMLPPPTLGEANKYSQTFNNFIAKCLMTNPEERGSATELLQDTFLTTASDPSVHKDRLRRISTAIAQSGRGVAMGQFSDSDEMDELEYYYQNFESHKRFQPIDSFQQIPQPMVTQQNSSIQNNFSSQNYYSSSKQEPPSFQAPFPNVHALSSNPSCTTAILPATPAPTPPQVSASALALQEAEELALAKIMSSGANSVLGLSQTRPRNLGSKSRSIEALSSRNKRKNKMVFTLVPKKDNPEEDVFSVPSLTYREKRKERRRTINNELEESSKNLAQRLRKEILVNLLKNDQACREKIEAQISLFESERETQLAHIKRLETANEMSADNMRKMKEEFYEIQQKSNIDFMRNQINELQNQIVSLKLAINEKEKTNQLLQHYNLQLELIHNKL